MKQKLSLFSFGLIFLARLGFHGEMEMRWVHNKGDIIHECPFTLTPLFASEAVKADVKC